MPALALLANLRSFGAVRTREIAGGGQPPSRTVNQSERKGLRG